MQLRKLVLCLALVAGCKDGTQSAPPSASADPAAPASNNGASAYKQRSGRIDLQVPRRPPSLDDGSADKPTQDDREARRAARREAMLKRLDKDGDGVVSDEERAAGQKERAESMHARFDLDGDGKLTVDELSQARWFRGDPAAADSDGDGVISVEELQQAMQAGRRGRRGGPADGGSGATL